MHPIAIEQFAGAVGIELGEPFVVNVVASVVTEVVEKVTVVERPVKPVVVTVMVLTEAVVKVEPLIVIGTLTVLRTVVLCAPWTGTMVAVENTTTVETVVMGTVTVCVVVPSADEVALLKGAVVLKGWSVDELWVGILVGNG